jgi:hypothetical protein
VQDHHPPARGVLQTAIPIADGTECRAIDKQVKAVRGKFRHDRRGLRQAAVVADNDFEVVLPRLGREAGEGLAQQIRPAERGNAKRNQRRRVVAASSKRVGDRREAHG